MKFEAVTIKDIAVALGLSTSTVSRALRDSYEISTETKKLVLEYAKKINYQPNPIALGLKERKTRIIGVIVSEIANSFFSQVIDGIESVAHKNGYTIIISQSHESFEEEARSLQHLTSRSVDGLLVSVSVETIGFELFNEAHTKGVPIVFFDRIVNEINTHKVIADNFKGAYEATKHLIDTGCKTIAALANVAYLSITKERIAGYKAALQDAGIAVNEDLIHFGEAGKMSEEEIENMLSPMLSPKTRPDAILGLSDKLTIACLRIFNKKNIKVPNDIKLMGFSNSDLSDLLNPALSIVKQPAFEMGETAAQMLVQLIQSKRPITSFETKTLAPQLIIRKSTAAKS